jgi:catechol-2,3-dioxygenase
VNRCSSTKREFVKPPALSQYGPMQVKRIVTNIAATDVSKARQFYVDILGLEIAMDLGWIVTFV